MTILIYNLGQLYCHFGKSQINRKLGPGIFEHYLSAQNPIYHSANLVIEKAFSVNVLPNVFVSAQVKCPCIHFAKVKNV
jgi:hypothetical protein